MRGLCGPFAPPERLANFSRLLPMPAMTKPADSRATPNSSTTGRGISRREFQRHVAGGLAGVWGASFGLGALGRAAAAAGTSSRQDDDQKKYPAGKFVDIHTHLGQVWNTYEPLRVEQLLRWMDANEVAQAIVLPLINPESSSYPLTPDFVLSETAPYRERLIPFCSIDPRTSFTGGPAALVKMLERYKAAGARGFGEHKPGIPMDDPRNLALYAACAEVELPILFHLDSERNTDQPGLPGVERALKATPQGTFIGHGPGWWASISGLITPEDLGGYPKGPVAEGGALDRLLDRFDNIYCDLSAGSGANAIQRDADFGREFLKRRADRLLFGTDFLRPEQDIPQFSLFAGIELPEDVQARIFRDNARKLLGL